MNVNFPKAVPLYLPTHLPCRSCNRESWRISELTLEAQGDVQLLVESIGRYRCPDGHKSSYTVTHTFRKETGNEG